jgi:hypothetical protein
VDAGKGQDELIEQALAVWQPRTKRKLSHEDAREIVANVTGFFQVLGQWSTRDQVASASVITGPQPLTVQREDAATGGRRKRKNADYNSARNVRCPRQPGPRQ